MYTVQKCVFGSMGMKIFGSYNVPNEAMLVKHLKKFGVDIEEALQLLRQNNKVVVHTDAPLVELHIRKVPLNGEGAAMQALPAPRVGRSSRF